MPVPAIPSGSVAPTAYITGSTATQPSSATGKSLDKDTFMSLLVAQLKYQDPMNPTDSAQFMAQTAQFSALEKMQDVAELTAKSLSAQLAFGASGMVGRTVSYTLDGKEHTGTVGSVTFGSDGPMLDVGGTKIRLDDVRGVTAAGGSPDETPAADTTDGPAADGSASTDRTTTDTAA